MKCGIFKPLEDKQTKIVLDLFIKIVLWKCDSLFCKRTDFVNLFVSSKKRLNFLYLDVLRIDFLLV